LKLLLALGNPGERYRDTRHNAGWWLADHLVVRWSLGAFRTAGPESSTEGSVEGQDVRVVKPQTFMNRSGRLLDRYANVAGFRVGEDLLVLVDDAALAPGRFRLRGSGSAGGHNGLVSVEQALGSREYGRLRIGVGAPPDSDGDLAAWVLAVPPASEEEAVLERFDLMARATERWIAEGVKSAIPSAGSPRG
jgi:PTH1 family peptidyl-tRNA hydrolase